MTKEDFMNVALNCAKKAKQKNEVPVGAVVVFDGKIIAKAYNQKQKKHSAVFHAEMMALIKAGKKLKSWNLSGCEIYVTKQPCLMCYGALLSSRINKIYFGAFDKKYGLEVDTYKELNTKGFNHTCVVEGGVLEKECSSILTNFFKDKR